jgi:hypothetical protein
VQAAERDLVRLLLLLLQLLLLLLRRELLPERLCCCSQVLLLLLTRCNLLLEPRAFCFEHPRLLCLGLLCHLHAAVCLALLSPCVALRLLRQYLYICTSKASKLSTSFLLWSFSLRAALAAAASRFTASSSSSSFASYTQELKA